MTTPGFTVWLTGPDPTALRAVADDIVARLAARHRAAEIFDAETPGIEVLAGERLEGRVAFLAEVLAHHEVATVVALGPPAGEARQACAQLIEVLVHAGEPRTSRYAPPERPEGFAAVLKDWGIFRVVGDNFAGGIEPGRPVAP